VRLEKARRKLQKACGATQFSDLQRILWWREPTSTSANLNSLLEALVVMAKRILSISYDPSLLSCSGLGS